MRALIFFVCSIPAPLTLAQDVRLEPSIATASAEFHQAQEEWLRDDFAGLAGQLLSGRPEVVHAKIRRQAALRDTMMEKKEVYLDLIVKRSAEIRGRLANAAGSKLPVAQLRSELEGEQMSILGDQERTESLLRDLPQGDEYELVRRDLQAEVNGLIVLQNDLAKQMRLIDRMDQAQEAANEIAASASLGQRLEADGKLWEDVLQKTKEQRTVWASIYSAMDREVDRGKAPVVASPKIPPATASAGKLPSPAVAPAFPPPDGGRNRQTFSGVWEYQSRSGAWTGFGEPESVRLVLTLTNGKISGTYLARIPGPRDMRNVSLRLTGEEVSANVAKLHWVSEFPPATGEMTLRLAGDGRVLLERTRSGDTYIPRGTEVLAPR